jgi:putative endonuclease
MTKARQELGRTGEDLAAEYLKKKGYRILERNVRTKLGEIDLVARKKDLLIFVEVKTGRPTPGFSPVDHFNENKRRKLSQLAEIYLARARTHLEVRIDLIAVTIHQGTPAIEHFEDVTGL